jgi:hypothetical protein
VGPLLNICQNLNFNHANVTCLKKCSSPVILEFDLVFLHIFLIFLFFKKSKFVNSKPAIFKFGSSQIRWILEKPVTFVNPGRVALEFQRLLMRKWRTVPPHPTTNRNQIRLLTESRQAVCTGFVPDAPTRCRSVTWLTFSNPWARLARNIQATSLPSLAIFFYFDLFNQYSRNEPD